MSWSYAGLAAAAASEVATRVPGTSFWGMVLLPSAAVLFASGLLIARRAPVTLAPFRRRRQIPDPAPTDDPRARP